LIFNGVVGLKISIETNFALSKKGSHPMQMKVGAVGLGVGIPKTILGVGFFNVGKIFLREYEKSNKEFVYNIGDLFSLGQKSGTFLAGGIETDWFELDPVKENWAFNTVWLIGKKLEIKMGGLQVLRGQADIEVVFFDKYNRPNELAKRCCLQSKGSSFSEIKIRGVAQRGHVDSKGRKITY
jgi:hypothetical protein